MHFVPSLGFVLLFVASPEKSGSFYRKIFNAEPIEESPTFVLFSLANGIMLGLWSRDTAQPTVKAHAGASEICFPEDDVDALYDAWLTLGITMAQEPIDMDFGRTFVALDPDGHRIRIYRLHEQK